MRVHLVSTILITGLLGFSLAPMVAMADTPDDQSALAGLKTAKVAFDLKDGDGRQMLYRLNIIDETRQSLIKQGVQPEFILTFRGPATKLVQSDLRELSAEERPHAVKIAAKLAEMKRAPGIQSLEQCAVAVRDQGVKAEAVLPEIRIVGNAWISLIAYQAKGYAYIAP
jgi:intracellular sulfur oxidation DsrE/DsrF family protein